MVLTVRFARTKTGHRIPVRPTTLLRSLSVKVSIGVGVCSCAPPQVQRPCLLQRAWSVCAEEDRGEGVEVVKLTQLLGLQGLDSLIIPDSESTAMAMFANYPTRCLDPFIFSV
ncbi:Os07g0146625 [Oryza sativa Japonica Group]|uniref:Os07g0146625 protein n=1 Tax=Oryza sativa subsp. japonica TaxID=39947 RepID=A0A0P0X2Q7_ORYSJ|nr:Os07g0146625 [Oryza sativa Japonica Group]